MGNLGSDCIISHLEHGLSHRNLNVVSAARRSLSEIKHINSEVALLRHFHDSSTVDTRSRIQVLRGLIKNNCSRRTSFSIWSSGLEIIGSPSSHSNETCHGLCSLRCSIRGPLKCSNFCSHRCANLFMFKAELGKFLYSTRKSGSFLDLVNDALSAGLFAGLSNLGIFPAKGIEPLIFGFAHNPIHWTKNFGTDIMGADLTLHLENRMRIWLSTYDRGMEVVLDDYISASAHAWIFSVKLIEAGISFQSTYSAFEPTPPDLKTTLSEWKHPPSNSSHPAVSTSVESIWKTSLGMDSMHQDESFLTIIDRHRPGQQAFESFCRLSENVSIFWSGAFEVESFEASNFRAFSNIGQLRDDLGQGYCHDAICPKVLGRK